MSAMAAARHLSRRVTQSPSTRLALLVLTLLNVWGCFFFRGGTTSPTTLRALLSSFTSPPPSGTNLSLSLPHIPSKIWQICLECPPSEIEDYPVLSWVSHSPSTSFMMVQNAGANAMVSRFSTWPGHKHPEMPTLYSSMKRRVMRGDFLRYLLLATEGGVYSDIDTEMIRPLHEWVPDEFKEHTKLIVGLEADQPEAPIPGVKYPVQFCQWTLASGPGHPVMWAMVDRILDKMLNRSPSADATDNLDYSDEEVLDITGPAGWTDVIMDHLSAVTGSQMSWRNLTGMREPRLYGDTLVLPIDGFATGMPHSHASPENSPSTMARHYLAGSWKTKDKEGDKQGDNKEE